MYRTYYEWDIEKVDLDSGDVLDHDHHDTLDTVPKLADDEELVLVRDTWRDDGELSQRSHWYPAEGRYDFSCGRDVPKKFIKKYHKWKEKNG